MPLLLSENQGLLAELVEDLDEGVAVHDVEGRFLYVNTLHARFFGVTAADLLGKCVWELFPEAKGNPFHQAFLRVAAGGPAESFEHLFAPWQRWFSNHIYRTPSGRVVVAARDITQRKEAEERESRHRRMIESMDDGFALLQILFDEQQRPIDGLLLEFNRAFELQAGFAPERGKTIRQCAPQIDEAGFARYGNVAVTGDSARFETFQPAVDRWFEVSLTRVGAPDQRQVAVVFENITDRRHADALLQESEARFRNMADDAPVMLWVADEQGRYTYLSRTWYDFTGQTPQSALGSGWLEVIHPDDAARTLELFTAAHLKRVPVTLEYRIKRNDGEYRWASSASRPRLGPRGEFLGSIGSVTDITDRKHDEDSRHRAVEAERKRMRELLEQAPVAIAVTTGRDQVFELANPRYAQLAGRPAQQLLGRTLRAAFSELPDDAPVFALAKSVFESGKAFAADEYKVRLDKKGDGTLEDTWFQFNLQPMRDEHGRVESLLTVSVDVTAQVEARHRIEALAAEREVLLSRAQASRAEAEAANQLKDEFLSTVSHELRTPLTAMLGWTQMLRSKLLPPEKRELGLETIERNARAQGQLIEDLLDVSRIMSGKLRLELATVELEAVVKQAVETVRPAAEAKGVGLQVELGALGTVLGDAQRLQQVVWNLLSNAVKFTSRGGTARVSARRDEANLELIVSDTGQGIAPEFMPHLFQRFSQADGSTQRQHGGLGIGLSLVKSLVELHGGTVTAASEGEGKGASFVVTVPLGVSSPRELAPVTRWTTSSHEVQRPPQLVDLHVLVADDDADSLEFLGTLLESCQARVSRVSSTAAALSMVREFRPRLIISDIGMPGEDGYAFIEQLRALSPREGGKTPAVALTAYARPEDKTRALLAGFDHHVSKPVEPSELLEVLVSLAGR